jgi:hypothetical protein
VVKELGLLKAQHIAGSLTDAELCAAQRVVVSRALEARRKKGNTALLAACKLLAKRANFGADLRAVRQLLTRYPGEGELLRHFQEREDRLARQ